MSELLPGLGAGAEAPQAPIRDATVVLLVRGRGAAREVFWVERGHGLRHFAGYRAFPGGKVDRADAEVAVAGHTGRDAARRVSAARELFEEAGVLLVEGAAQVPLAQRKAWRQALLDDQLTFAQVLAQAGKPLDASLLVPAGRWLTPPFLPVRFDAWLFWVDLPAGQDAEVWPGELASGEWITPAAALARWARGETLLHPPSWNAMDALGRHADVQAALQQLREPEGCVDFVSDRIAFQQGVRLVPLRTPTLPPATHTNTYILGDGELLVVDPGSPFPDEQARLAGHLERLTAQGCTPRAIFLTHHHGDHLGGVAALQARFGLPLWAHADTAKHTEGWRTGRDRLLVEGEQLVLRGQPDQAWTVLHTPGHARGHLCLLDGRSRALVCGDMVAGNSTIVIDPPEGHLGDYLASLRRLRDLGVGTLYQSHGAPIAEGPQKLQGYLDHRQARLDAIAAALAAGPLSVAEVVAQVYADTPLFLHPIAERSALASLEHLVETGAAALEGDRYRRA
jgi:glyoxylase-like metal-dependent hydrolase (beta-lactamase superfamily II)/8-oxo-dGTP pyrophosphatase MutT (NUDIX family)